jgi:AbrB family looped-hinge helix DNA binding protein
LLHTFNDGIAMEATVAERGQITLPKAVRDALGLTKGTR